MKTAITLSLFILGIALIAYGWHRYQESLILAKTEVIVQGRIASFENRTELVVGGGAGYDTSQAMLWWIIEYSPPQSNAPLTLAVRDRQLRHVNQPAVGSPVSIAFNPDSPKQARLFKPQADRVIYLSLFGMGALILVAAAIAWR